MSEVMFKHGLNHQVSLKPPLSVCPLCKTGLKDMMLANHLKLSHTTQELHSAILKDKLNGLPDVEIGQRYGISFRQLESIITTNKGINISVLRKSKKIKLWEPKDFKEEQTTVWSFKRRGNWATHSGEYRGNWSPYVPRNVILKYSRPDELVLDYFCGAGTTAVEAKLLGRKCIALDINKQAIELANKNIDFGILPDQQLLLNERTSAIYEPELKIRDARDLSFLKENSVDLICAHPPYADIIHYTNNKEDDLSFLGIDEFLEQMVIVAKESYRVLKPGRQCAILIGDTRKKKSVIPLGFNLINVYLDAGFKLKELVIKRQHNCKTTGFWYANSIKYNFLLLAHEYLPIFEKPLKFSSRLSERLLGYGAVIPLSEKLQLQKKLRGMETTTVWVLPEEDFTKRLNKNIINRYSKKRRIKLISLSSDKKKKGLSTDKYKDKDLLYIKSPCLESGSIGHKELNSYLEEIKGITTVGRDKIAENGYLVIQTKDVRIGDYVEPMANQIINELRIKNLFLKEIIMVTNNSNNRLGQTNGKDLKITHQYLLVYKKVL